MTVLGDRQFSRNTSLLKHTFSMYSQFHSASVILRNREDFDRMTNHLLMEINDTV